MALVLFAFVFLSLDVMRPLVDYDEAIYAKVVMDKMHSGNVLSFLLSGNNFGLRWEARKCSVRVNLHSANFRSSRE